MTEVIITAPVTLALSPDLSSPDISQQSEIKKFVHTTIDSMEQQLSTLLSQNISGNSSLLRHILMKSLQVGLDKKDHFTKEIIPVLLWDPHIMLAVSI